MKDAHRKRDILNTKEIKQHKRWRIKLQQHVLGRMGNWVLNMYQGSVAEIRLILKIDESGFVPFTGKNGREGQTSKRKQEQRC